MKSYTNLRYVGRNRMPRRMKAATIFSTMKISCNTENNNTKKSARYTRPNTKISHASVISSTISKYDMGFGPFIRKYGMAYDSKL